MKVLLVDDEILTIRMLQTLLPWKELGLELVGYAQDGHEAYRKILEDAPDIVISDIKMPGMSGIELLKKITALSSGIRTILMSAYADFSYAKEAMKSGCYDYILKPVDETELEQVLRKAVSDIQGEKEQERIISRSVRQLDSLNLYHYMRTGHGLNKIRGTQCALFRDAPAFSVFMLQLNSGTIDEYNDSYNMELAQSGYILSIVENVLEKEKTPHICFDYEEGTWTILLAQTDTAQQELAKEIIGRLREEAGLSLSVCFSSYGKEPEDLPFLFEEVKSLSKYSFYIGDADILGYGYNCNRGELDEVRDIGMAKDIDQVIRERDRDRLRLILNEAFELAPRHYPGSQKNICELCYQTVLAMRKYLTEEELGPVNYGRLYEITYEKLSAIPSQKELKQVLLEIIAAIPAAAESLPEKSYSKPVAESLAFINDKYNQNISLNEICAAVSVSKNYFCYLFKRETGMSLWNYLTVIRLQHAKELLLQTDLKSYEIAFQVGYDNPSYFSKLFKKYEQMTPNEYREKTGTENK